ncbi:UDP-glucose 4-epimerase GalE [Myroides odoratus]|jgi:UDP-glucose 4-epimerase|uniref:UDP-glucose 4-epimerase n=1 Tax=Myroides odoratus TaxID=256 RepID=A0A9Q6ZEJ2_MYROD|nr:UDP-glucose 4-epimerase GalE [Myroides odoratus]EHQ43950.1 UDP-glucose 4-epimerase [Myroides odoratus DSM 2801]EKB04932.1 UDP-glucose 4-epimerase [Myroides odoratus CIP 103059]QQU01251.1 UDP-glucose 4-epimerase GalE [Myroides odoratus]WQD56491.1 UDP-glucose 4-epimerase GalE [Myroides odoratus]STZ31227.1 UDP-glucose 4-epimerase [Myroides odoratus]
MKILVTGGLGFIGSHTVVALQQKGYEVVIIDDLSNAAVEVVDGIKNITGHAPLFEKIDLRDKSSVFQFFDTHQDIEGVIHFAASKAVGESMKEPLAYYENNFFSLINVLSAMKQKGLDKIIFSSSCTVYGQGEVMPITEEESIKTALSPYGNTKQVGEEIIVDLAKVYPLQAVLLRYFNPIGAHESGFIGESPVGVPYNLIPYITQTAVGIRPYLSIYGDDYDTADGTCVRDYIHVVDLADAHVRAMEYLLKKENTAQVEAFNVGNGQGYSVLELVHSFERVSGIKINYKIVERRPGDIDKAWANTDKIERVLGWKPTKNLDDMLASAWNWERKSRNY